jgi:RNA recognition motif-containing protein
MNIYVGNLSSNVKEEDLREAFEAFGQVSSIKIISDRLTGQPKGFGFIEMPDKTEAESAISELNGKEMLGQSIKVNEAYPRRDNRKRGTGFGGRRRF